MEKCISGWLKESKINIYVCVYVCFSFSIQALTSHLYTSEPMKTMSHSWVQHSGVSVLLTTGHFDQLVGRTAKEMKSNSPQLARVVLMEPFKEPNCSSEWKHGQQSDGWCHIPAVTSIRAGPTTAKWVSARRIPRNTQLLDKACLKRLVSAGALVTPLPATRSPKACWLKRARLNQHMLRLVMTPLPLLLLVYQCSLVLPSIFGPP